MNGQAAKAHNTVCQWRAMIHAWGRGDNSIRKDLQHTHKDLNLTLRTQVKKLTWWAYLQSACCRSRHRKSPGVYQPASLGKLLSLRLPRPGLKNKVNGSQDKISKVVLCFHKYKHTCACIPMHKYTLYTFVFLYIPHTAKKRSLDPYTTQTDLQYTMLRKRQSQKTTYFMIPFWNVQRMYQWSPTPGRLWRNTKWLLQDTGFLLEWWIIFWIYLSDKQPSEPSRCLLNYISRLFWWVFSFGLLLGVQREMMTERE